MLTYIHNQIPGAEGVWEIGGTYYCSILGVQRTVTQFEILNAARVKRKADINEEAHSRIVTIYPLEKQSSAQLGIYPTSYKDKMASDIEAIIAASNTACDAVDAAINVAEIDNISVNWPVIGV